MKKVTALIMVFLLTAGLIMPAAYADEEIILADNGATDYRIVISADASEAEKTAAQVLSGYLEKISSAKFVIVTDNEPAHEEEIVIGMTNRDGEISIDRTEFEDDGVRILTVGRKLFLTGGVKRGAIYAVYTFLEDTLGCRWFTEELTVIPEMKRLAISHIDYAYVPCFRLRQTYWLFSTKYADFCVAHKLHGVMAYVTDELGGCGEEYAVNSVHTLQWIIPRNLFEEHPEYFGCDENGVRSPKRQPCLSNEDVFRLTVDYAMDFFAKYNTILSISQNDGMSFCQCEKCRAFNKAHGGTDSASMVHFVNRVAAAVREKYPDARFETLAYQDTLTPPKNLAIADGIVIRMCPVNGCVLHDFDDAHCPENAKFDKAVSEWAKLTESIYMWNYSTNFQYYYAVFPNIMTLQKRYQYFRDNNVVAVFDNGCGDDIVPGELHELKTYLVLKLLWDPDTDVEKHISEFCAAYYGEAGADVVRFIHGFESAVKGYNLLTLSTCHMTCQDGGDSLENHSSLTETEIRRLDKIIADAESRNLTDAEAERLRGLTISWRFFKCATFAGEYNWFISGNNPEKEAEKLYNDMKNYGIRFLSEGGGGRFTDAKPNFRVRPTWWFADEADTPQSAQLLTNVLSAVNRILRAGNILHIIAEIKNNVARICGGILR